MEEAGRSGPNDGPFFFPSLSFFFWLRSSWRKVIPLLGLGEKAKGSCGVWEVNGNREREHRIGHCLIMY